MKLKNQTKATKASIVKTLAERLGVSRADAGRIYETVGSVVAGEVKQGRAVGVPSVGVLKLTLAKGGARKVMDMAALRAGRKVKKDITVQPHYGVALVPDAGLRSVVANRKIRKADADQAGVKVPGKGKGEDLAFEA